MNGKNDLFSYVDHLYINGIEVKDMIVPDGILSIVDYAFSGCNSLTSLYLPNSVISIGVSAYDSCNGLTSITIPNSVTTIGNEAFANCLNLTSLTIPNSVTSIGDGAFQNCSRLTSLTIGEGVTEIGPSAFSGCASLTSVDIPDNIKNIGTYAFYGCKGLATVNMGNSVMDIGYGAFCGCGNLTSLEIPNSVTNISWNAFKDCPNITSVKVHWKRPLAGGADSFLEDVKKNATLYVPKGTAMMYMSAPEWSKFVNIIEYEDGEDAHHITIRMGDGGVLKQSVEVGQTYTYAVSADEGWEINTLTFDGKDMTSLLMDGQFSTPVITGNAELNVVFKQIGSEIKAMTSVSDVKVYAANKNIIVAGAEENAQVAVYGINGAPVASAVGNATFILESGVYIVKVGEETFKVRL